MLTKNLYKKLLLLFIFISSSSLGAFLRFSDDYIPSFNLEFIKNHPYFTTGILTTAALGISCFAYKKYFNTYEERWDYDKVDILDVEFPPDFIWGTADSAFQTEGVVTTHGKKIKNTWTAWEKQEIIKDGIQQPRFPKDERAGKACERWTHYKEDIQLIKKLGMNAHRYSIEWSKIETARGVFDTDAMQHYIDYTKELIDNGIQPIPTLWHHTCPLWFVNQTTNDTNSNLKPGFEDSRNIQDFVDFTVYVFNAFKGAGLLNNVTTWLTFNEPIGFALSAYVDGKLPPGKKFDFKTAGIVAKNMLDAHIAIYDAFDPHVQIGFAHVMTPIQPYTPWNPLDQISAKIFDNLVNDVALEYFKTGNFNWLYLVKNNNPNAIKKLDFIGVNYYTHTLLSMFQERTRPDEIVADGYPKGKRPKSLYAEGFYNSLKKASTLGIPILITENGFAAKTDSLREDYLKKHIYAISKAIKDGIDIRGYLFWTLTDCFGWNSGQHSNHGIYQVDFETQERTFKPSAQYLVDVIASSKN